MTFTMILGAIAKLLSGIFLVGVLIFLPAGTVAFFQGWLLMGILFLPMLLSGIVMVFKNPALLKSRLDAKEKRGEQSRVVKLSALMFLLGFTVSGLGVRFQWYVLPTFVSLIFAIVFLVGYLMYAEVLRENTYLSRTVRVQKGQRLIDTGLYGIVRHPMYTATLLMFLSMPLVLGSVWAFPIFLCYPFLIAARIRDEETLLSEELEGYRDYQSRVRYRLIPFIW
ncbi:MAG: isoprenylcysteine carboxylmethyltransferase family protein [Clostridia bacterium]|nr:isoprenylcysteine carboxylmethyltransferase family protein [Clostridia bacterium]